MIARLAARRPFSGFVDLQVNGCGGTDFAAPDLTRDQVTRAFDAILSSGTAAFLATLVSAPMLVYRRNLALICDVARMPAYQNRVLGIHLEGPFLVDDHRVSGAHRPTHFLPPAVETLNDLIAASQNILRMITVSAELAGIDPVIAHAKSCGVRVAIGHSYFTADDLTRTAGQGATLLTHFGNALPPNLPRHENPLIAGLAQDDLSAMVILDGHHLPRELFKTMLRVFGPDRLLMTSDLSPVAGLGPGRHTVFDQPVCITRDGAIWNQDELHFAGAGKSMCDCANTALSWGFVSPEDVWQMGVLGPLRALGLGLADLPQTGTPIAYCPGRDAFASEQTINP